MNSSCPDPSIKAPPALDVLDMALSIGGLQGKFFRLLSALAEKGSLVAAAKEAGLSYKGAWDMLERAQQRSPRALIESSPGGGPARGTRLTETGYRLLEIHRLLENRKHGFLQSLNDELASDPILLQWYRGMIMRSSTRNQWQAEVLSIKKGVVTHLVTARLAGGSTLVASLSEEALSLMALKFGSRVIAMVKAPMVHLVAGGDDFLCAADNQFKGRISNISGEATGIEVRIRLDTQETLVSTLSALEFAALGSAEGDEVRVLFDAEAVLLATSIQSPLGRAPSEES